MPITYTQTDAAADCGAMAACSGGTVGTTTGTSELIDGGTAGSTEQTIELDSGTFLGFFFQTSGGVGKSTWESGTYSCGLEVTTAETDLSLEGIYLCRVDSSCNSLATVGSDTSMSQTLNVGTYSFNVSGTQQSASSTDDLYVIYEFTNSHNNQLRSAGITPSQDIATPLVQSQTATAAAASTTSTSINPTATPGVTSVAPGPAQITASAVSSGVTNQVSISGTITVDGSAVSGAKVHLLNQTDNTYKGTTTSDVNGHWTIDVSVDNSDLFIAMAQYDDGSTKYETEAKPYLSPG